MKIDWSGRTAIVTGSTAGIGRATTEGLARAGASIIINGRSLARVSVGDQRRRPSGGRWCRAVRRLISSGSRA